MADFAGMFSAAGCTGSLHVVRLHDGAEIAHEADRTQVMASIVKVPIALTLYRATVGGTLDPSQQVRLAPENTTPGPVGISRFGDPVTISLRDLGYLMLTISDNAATDAVLQAVGVAAVDQCLDSLGCHATVVFSDIATMLDGVAADLGFADYRQLLAAQQGELGPEASAAATDPGRIDHCRALDPTRASRTTARDMTRLLAAIWDNTAGPANACATLRSVMAEQVTRRLGPAVADGGSVAAKSGGLFGRVRNEVGVIVDPDGTTYAVAVLTRAHEPFKHEADINSVMADTVRTGIDLLRND